jgi:hypothetical protein
VLLSAGGGSGDGTGGVPISPSSAWTRGSATGTRDGSRPRTRFIALRHDLLQACLDRFAHVRQRVLLTDDEAHQHRLY